MLLSPCYLSYHASSSVPGEEDWDSGMGHVDLKKEVESAKQQRNNLVGTLPGRPQTGYPDMKQNNPLSSSASVPMELQVTNNNSTTSSICLEEEEKETEGPPTSETTVEVVDVVEVVSCSSGCKDGRLSSSSSKIQLERKCLVLLFISLLASVYYWTTSIHPLLPLRTFSKATAIVSIIGIVILHWKTKQDRLLAIALLFHSIGDIVLAQELLLFAIPPFMLGHFFYICLFKADLPIRYSSPASIKTHLKSLHIAKHITIISGLSFCFILALVLLPVMPTYMVVPVLLYMMLICSMGVSALLPSYRLRWMAIGALLYCASDSLVAVDTFYMALPVLGLMSWPLYYISQLLITLGMLKEKDYFNYVIIERDIPKSILSSRSVAFLKRKLGQMNTKLPPPIKRLVLKANMVKLKLH